MTVVTGVSDLIFACIAMYLLEQKIGTNTVEKFAMSLMYACPCIVV